jgi:hypothetical protein
LNSSASLRWRARIILFMPLGNRHSHRFVFPRLPVCGLYFLTSPESFPRISFWTVSSPIILFKSSD